MQGVDGVATGARPAWVHRLFFLLRFRLCILHHALAGGHQATAFHLCQLHHKVTIRRLIVLLIRDEALAVILRSSRRLLLHLVLSCHLHLGTLTSAEFNALAAQAEAPIVEHEVGHARNHCADHNDAQTKLEL